MKKTSLLLCLLMLNTIAHAESSVIYKWIDSNGDVHFSDRPHSGAEALALPKAQTYSAPTSTPKPDKEIPSELMEPVANYDKVEIVQPDDQVTIRNPQGYVSILASVNPNLKKGDKLQLMFDGAPIGSPQSASVFSLRDINRGSHTLAVAVVQPNGKILKMSDTITIFMMQSRQNMIHNTP